ncbi:ATP synthase 24 kDa subunit, mitochondrial [Artemisia annua]|uniref:ATP synthase 24 kDa subunit, mitochondrial n=1 Tax=Artemisia annua TaxID=35608 RepID=A0A2U1KRT6_ARTAN|nr:ATP synthase 24 kDa subunit, mitochondrial [Artemisia annua]
MLKGIFFDVKKKFETAIGILRKEKITHPVDPAAIAHYAKVMKIPFVSKLGICKQDLPKYEGPLELKIAKAQLEELKKDAHEAMDKQKKSGEFKDEEMVDVKSLDIRNFI